MTDSSDTYLIRNGGTVEITVAESPERIGLLVVPGIGGASAETYVGVLAADLQDGTQTVFPLPQPALDPPRIEVHRNGLREVYGHGFTATGTEIVFTTPPAIDDVIGLSYAL